MATDSVPPMNSGGWTDCVNDLKGGDFSKWLMDEINKSQKKKLELVAVLKSQKMIVDDIGSVLYKLFLEVKDDDGRHKQCIAVVLVKPDGSKELKEFHFVEFNQEIIGGWTDAGNDSKVGEIIKWVIDQINKSQKKHVKLVSVLAVQTKIVDDIGTVLYRLLLEIIDGDVIERIEVLALVMPDGSYFVEFYFVEFNREIIGGWTDAGNDVGIEDMAKFAVDEYNKKEGTTLEFTKLKTAQKKLEAGILYKLTLEAIDDGDKKLYQAMVIVIPWEKIKKLEDFKPLLLNDED